MFSEHIDGLFYKITEWCIKYGAIKTTEKLPFGLPNNASNLCFSKLTDEQNKKNTFEIFIL